MYTLVRRLSFRSLATTQLPALAVSLLVAELCFKFKSFTLECLAFLATWFVVDAAWSSLQALVGARTEGGDTTTERR